MRTLTIGRLSCCSVTGDKRMDVEMEEAVQNNHARWQGVEEIYHAALPLSSEERAKFVIRACSGDEALYEEVSTLLAADDAASGFLQETIFPLGLEILADENLLSTEIVSEPMRPSSVDPMIGARVCERYEIIERLGGGGMGDVYLARDKPEMMGRLVVIKILREDRLANEWVVTKFQQEAEALTKIDDPGVVGIFDAGKLPDGKPFLVMPYVAEGQNLREYFDEKEKKDEEIELHEIAEIVRQAGRTLTVAHHAGIVHRDLKPENIMLRRNVSGNLQVKIIDFGIARVANSVIAPSTETIHIVGTWQYMSPEQLRGEKATPLSDIYALGIIAYEMLTGRRPFNGRNPVQLAEMQKGGVKVMPRALRSEIAAKAQDVILKALSYSPAERYKSAQTFGEDLAQALTLDEEKEAVPQTLHTSYRRWLAGGLALVLVGALGFALWRIASSETPQQPQTQAQSQSQQPLSNVPERTLTYWLSVQRKRDKTPFDSIGERIFDSGSRFWLNIQTTQAGALYLFSEGKNDRGEVEWNLMFPTPANNSADALLPANKSLRTTGYVFDDQPGMVKIWVVWARERVTLLDDLIQKSLNRPREEQGVISQPKQLRDFIEQYRTTPTEIALDKERFRITLKGRDAILVDMRELEYQP